MSVENTEEKNLPTFIKAAITAEIERATLEELTEAQKRMEKRSAEIIAGVILHVEKRMTVQTLANELIIKVSLETK